jgi:VWFA-related protein
MIMSRCRRLSILTFLVVLAGFAQQDSVVFRTGVTLVEVSVVVRDATGNPVPDLKQEDFRLIANGEERQIVSFTKPRLSQQETNGAPALPPGVFTNAPEQSRDSRGLSAILVDSLNTCVTDQMAMKRQLVVFLREAPVNTRFALYSVSNELQVLHDFASEPEMLIDLLRGIPLDASVPQPVQSADQQTPQLRDGRIDGFMQSPILERQLRFWLDEQRTLSDNVRHDQRVRNSLGALETVVRRMERAPGKKSLIWLSGGFQELIGQPQLGVNPTGRSGPNPPVTMPDEIFDVRAAFQSLLKYANRVGVTIYPLDSRGLTPFGDISPAVCDGIHAGEKLQNQQVLQEAAKVTGGIAMVNTNDLSGALQQIYRDIGGTYSLGFYVAAEEAVENGSQQRRNRGRRGQQTAGTTHRDYTLQISVKTPGMQVAHRALLSVNHHNRGNMDDALQSLLQSPVDSAGLVFMAGMLGPSEQTGKQVLQVLIPTDSLQFEQDGSQSRTTVRLAVASRSADGKQLHAETTTIRATLTAQQMEQARAMGLILRHPVTAPSGTSTLRVAIAEDHRGLTGSLTIDLQPGSQH